MSWLTGITGKAEEFLNKIDQSAADALKNEQIIKSQSIPPTSPSYSSSSHGFLGSSQTVPAKLSILPHVDKSSSYVNKPIRPSGPKTPTSVAPTTKQVSGSKQQGSSPVSQRRLSGSQPVTPQSVVQPPSTKKKLDTDEALFDFLNSNETVDSNRKKITPISSARHSRQSSTSSTVSSKGGIKIDAPPSTSSSSIVHIDSVTGSGKSI